MPDKHAVLAPSSAERWITCPGSIRLTQEALEAGLIRLEPPSAYAAEGTRAHTLGEIEIKRRFGIIDEAEYQRRWSEWAAEAESPEEIEEMSRYIAEYVELIEEKVAEFPMSQVLVEQKVDTGVPECWGTADIVIVSPEHVEIVDLKYGQGTPVNAYENPQLKLYAVGALETIGDLLGDPKVVRCSVFQPRIDNSSTFEISADDLRAWRDSVIPIAKSALDGTGEINPTEDACRWCPVAGICRARTEKFASLDFATPPDLLTPEEIGELVDQLPEIRGWCSAVEEAALEMAYSLGVTIPGHKVVMSGGKRSITDNTKAIELLNAAGFADEDITRQQMQTLGHLEKLVGKKELAEVLTGVLVKSPGKPAIVHDGDPRPAVDPNTEAQKEFQG